MLYCRTHCQLMQRVITTNHEPDHSAINRFRKDNESQLKKMFLEISRGRSEAGLIKIGKLLLTTNRTFKRKIGSFKQIIRILQQLLNK